MSQSHHGYQEGSLNREENGVLDSIGEGGETSHIRKKVESPVQDMHSAHLFYHPTSIDNKFAIESLTIEASHLRSSEKATSDYSIYNEGKKFFIAKHFGKSIVVGIWVGLIIANLICLVKMRTDDF